MNWQDTLRELAEFQLLLYFYFMPKPGLRTLVVIGLRSFWDALWSVHVFVRARSLFRKLGLVRCPRQVY